MSYHVNVLHQAYREADAIVHWLFQRSPEGAARWINAFDSAMIALAENPQRHGLASEIDFVPHEVRQTFFGTPAGRRYRAVFTIVADEVRVLHVRGPGQRLLRAEEL